MTRFASSGSSGAAFLLILPAFILATLMVGGLMFAMLMLVWPGGCYPSLFCPAPRESLPAEPTRWVELPGALNARDLGGYGAADGKTVRWHKVYRSAALHALTGEGCQAFANLRIKTVIDMRNRLLSSPLFGGDVLCVHCCAEVHLLPVKDVRDANVFESAQWIELFREGLPLLADADRLPLLFHCGAGKDRAGAFSAVLLAILGVDRQDIVDDYLLSAEVSDPAPILRLLDSIDQKGGIESVTASLGVPAQTLAAIRENLLE
ncbi:MAG TPA: tyrosine-protein phosphatase [Phycisphaerae bacterium]|nr:tyrosine-protein phosphatase [Phycisphaerae bacterium]